MQLLIFQIHSYLLVPSPPSPLPNLRAVVLRFTLTRGSPEYIPDPPAARLRLSYAPARATSTCPAGQGHGLRPLALSIKSLEASHPLLPYTWGEI